MLRPLRQLAVSALLTVALATGAMAQSDSAVVVTFGPDGFALQALGDAPVGEEGAVLLRRGKGNGWAMSTLSEGDVPSEVAARPYPNVFARRAHSRALESHREALGAHERALASQRRAVAQVQRLSGEVVDVLSVEPHRTVMFEVSAQLGALTMGDALVNQLSEDQALRSLEVSESINSGTLEAQFMFDGMEAWNEWKRAPETVQMLDALREATGQMRTRMQVRH